MECIFCLKKNEAKSIEHIVSESLGNTIYLMERGRVCDACNKRFANFEREALSSTVLLMERARMGIPNKKGNAAQGVIGKIGIQGNKDFLKNLVTLGGLPQEEIADWDPQKQTFSLKLPAFDKNEVAVSKTLLKIGLESLFTSKRKVFKKYDFTQLRQFLDNSDPTEWPMVVFSGKTIGTFESIPINIHKYHLSRFRCSLLFQEKDSRTLLFKFSYGGIHMMINLLNRDLDWLEEQQAPATHDTIYPAHYRKKLEKHLEKKAKDVVVATAKK
ncbi:HNH endonuclease [Pedobacter antarcticus]|uniref:HNH endonuclease n=1 Tax=Pedobacter antarcticus TaxID=34086 RepID=UPI00088F4E34|nr:HNH endonuclease [Pedobacter antarcticus]SDL51542.1 HNH endonuclease [Pedobacter antarcticus]